MFSVVDITAMPSNDGSCKDVSLVFLRGSGQNKGSLYLDNPLDERTFGQVEKESYTFFKHHADHFKNDYPNIDFKAVTVHDFPGKYDPVGYKAVGVGLGEIANTANADASWVPGDYQASVQHGVEETVGYMKDQIATCPNQYFIVGGYSQGAQVMGESLFRLTDDERSKILGVGFFGDPKYLGSTDGLPVKVNPTVSFPWRRGEATNRDAGMLEPRFPYVPEELSLRTISWCSRYDIVCGGWSAFRKGSSHSSYSGNAIGYAVNQLVDIATPQLLALDQSPDGSGIPPVQLSEEDMKKQRDVMFLFNDNSNLDVIRTLKGIDPMMPLFLRNFEGLNRFAAKSFGENDYGSFHATRVDNIQPFLPLKGYDPSRPVFTSSNLSAAMLTKYGMLPYIYGGGDIKDPHQFAIERGVVSTGWRDDPTVEKNIILITDRPPKDPVEYNICNGVIRQWMHYPDVDGYKNCYTNYHREVWQKALVPETCETITKVIMEDICVNPLMSPSWTQINKRTLEDEIKLAQAYHVRISVIIPHKFDPVTHAGNTLSDPKVRDKLRRVAEATGGIYVYYDNKTEYTSTLLQDTLWRVFTKQPSSLKTVTEGEDAPRVLSLQTKTPVILDVSRSGVAAASYKWDFDDNGTWDETSQGPVIEHEFPEVAQGIFRVQALSANNTVLAETRQVYNVGAGYSAEPELPNVPADVQATQQADGTTLVTWSPEATNEIVVIDPETNLPITSAPLTNSSVIIPDHYPSLIVRVISDDAASDPSAIPVTTYVPPVPIVDVSPTGTNTEEPLCGGLLLCIPGPQPPVETEDTPTTTLTQQGRAINPVAQAVAHTESELTTADTQNTPTPIDANNPEVEGISVVNSSPTQTNPVAQQHQKSETNWWFLVLIAAIIVTVVTSIRYAASKHAETR